MPYSAIQSPSLTWIFVGTIWFFFLILMLAPVVGYSLESSRRFFYIAIVLWVSALFFDLLPPVFPEPMVTQVCHVLKVGTFCSGLFFFAQGLFEIKKT